jgi:hypothetical protein
MSVFEYGSGGSTLFFCDRVKRVVSVEHDAAWHQMVSQAISGAHAGRCEYLLRPPDEAAMPRDDDPPPPWTYASRRHWPRGQVFQRYATAILDYPDAGFDVVLIDGRVRPVCAWHASGKIKPGGWLVLDNSDREDYQPIWDLLADWPVTHFEGLVPYSRAQSRTSVLRKPG